MKEELNIFRGVACALLILALLGPIRWLFRRNKLLLLLLINQRIKLLFSLGCVLMCASFVSPTLMSPLFAGGSFVLLLAHRLSGDSAPGLIRIGYFLFFALCNLWLAQAHQSRILFSSGFICVRVLLTELDLPPIAAQWLGHDDQYTKMVDQGVCTLACALFWLLFTHGPRHSNYYILPLIGSMIVPLLASLGITAHKGFTSFWKNYIYAQIPILVLVGVLRSAAAIGLDPVLGTVSRLAMLIWGLLKLLDLPSMHFLISSCVYAVLGSSLLWFTFKLSF
jgi:hypothetical protein